MRTKIKSIRSRPPVGVGVAVGELRMRADDLVDAAILLAISDALTSSKSTPALKSLRMSIQAAAAESIKAIHKHAPFTMLKARKVDAT